ncbi:MAG: SLBB domain-containing protein [Gemmatimonadetes bacterium]|nr:SLBB domain-containing protein [Gemmatimonadota bacterium]MBI2538117.1 SLBB domain-containing protein [Gemmatimonadota bacterium]
MSGVLRWLPDPRIVQVMGAVNSPTSVRYQRGKGFEYYVANAGGYASRADKGRASVRYADGSARVRDAREATP